MPGDELVLQVSLAPPDVPHARTILPHQLRQWRPHVDRIVLTPDTRPGTGRYRTDWDRLEPALDDLLDDVATDPAVSVVRVDYGRASLGELSAAFLGGAPLPAKDSHGAPFLAYLFGLQAAAARYVIHTDADMLFGGGGGASWRRDVLRMMQEDDDVLLSGPFPCPPRRDGRLAPGVAERARRSQVFGSQVELTEELGGTLVSRHATTRCFLIDLDRFRRRVGELDVVPARPSRFSRRSPGALPLEVALSAAMQRHGLVRKDVLGSAPGMWSLHPPFRSPRFLERLPEIIGQVERDDVPDAQRGDFDLNDSMVDWSSARRRARVRGRRLQVERRISELVEMLDRAPRH